MYLMIENRGEADVRSFTTLGLSTSRGDAASIGQFGSGAKHGILLLLRQGISPYIYCGTTRVEFFTKPNLMNNTEYNSVFCRIGNKTQELSYCLEFGALDWNKSDMALREFVSNAIDQSKNISEVRIDVVDKPRAKSGCTRVFVEVNNDITRFYNDLKNRFLHFNGQQNYTLLDKNEISPARVYRKGVFVRQLSTHKGNSLFDYNLGEELPIDESRNLDDWKCESSIGLALSKSTVGIRTIFESFVNGTNSNCFEHNISQYHLRPEKKWKDIWEQVAQQSVIVQKDSVIVEQLIHKGFNVITVPDGWYNEMKRIGIPAGVEKLSKVESRGCILSEATPSAQNMLNEVWNWLVNFNLTANKVKPPVVCFSKPTDAGSTLFGYCENNTVYINIDHDNDHQTMLEELAHYITGSTDNSRDFQDFAFKVATRMGEMLFS